MNFHFQIVLLNCLTWSPTLQLRLEPIVKAGNYLSRVFKECIIKESKDSNRASEETPISSDKHISKTLLLVLQYFIILNRRILR